MPKWLICSIDCVLDWHKGYQNFFLREGNELNPVWVLWKDPPRYYHSHWSNSLKALRSYGQTLGLIRIFSFSVQVTSDSCILFVGMAF